MPEFNLTPQLRAWAEANGYGALIDLHAEWFADYLVNRPGKPYKDLNAAFRNCVRSDWGGIRRMAKPKTAPSFLDARPGESMEDYLTRKRREQTA